MNVTGSFLFSDVTIGGVNIPTPVVVGNFSAIVGQSISNKTLNGTVPTEVSWVYWVPGPFICTFGIICNLLNLIVLSQKELKDSPYSFLTALAISDLCVLVLSLVHLTTSQSSNTFLKAFFNCYIFFPVSNVFFNTSVWIVVALTIERMFFVIRPFTARSSRKKAWLCNTAILLFCVIINIPRFLCFDVFYFLGGYYPKGTAFRSSKTYYIICWFHAVIINFVPFLLLIITNTVLVFSLHKSSKDRKSLRSNREEANQKDQARLTRTLIVVVVVFFVCVIPSAFVDDPIAYSLFGQGRTWGDFIRSPANQMLIYISNLLVFFNSSLNFVLYCAFNQRFRRVAKRLIWKVRSGGKRILLRVTEEDHSHTTYSNSGTSVTHNTHL